MTPCRTPRSRRLQVSLLLCALVVPGCTLAEPPDPGGPSLETRPDGERGHGWFQTPWGAEEVDYTWHHGQRVYDGDLVLDPGSELPAGTEGRAQQPLLSRASLRWAMDPSTGVVTIPYEISNTGALGSSLFDQTQAASGGRWTTGRRMRDGPAAKRS